MKTATASTSLEIWVTCPYCKIPMDVYEELIDSLQGNLRAPDIEKEIICHNPECEQQFIVTQINY